MDPLDLSNRSLELLCRTQAALSSTSDTRSELKQMALEYTRLADRQDRRIDRHDQATTSFQRDRAAQRPADVVRERIARSCIDAAVRSRRTACSRGQDAATPQLMSPIRIRSSDSRKEWDDQHLK